MDFDINMLIGTAIGAVAIIFVLALGRTVKRLVTGNVRQAQAAEIEQLRTHIAQLETQLSDTVNSARLEIGELQASNAALRTEVETRAQDKVDASGLREQIGQLEEKLAAETARANAAEKAAGDVSALVARTETAESALAEMKAQHRAALMDIQNRAKQFLEGKPDKADTQKAKGKDNSGGKTPPVEKSAQMNPTAETVATAKDAAPAADAKDAAPLVTPPTEAPANEPAAPPQQNGAVPPAVAAARMSHAHKAERAKQVH